MFKVEELEGGMPGSLHVLDDEGLGIDMPHPLLPASDHLANLKHLQAFNYQDRPLTVTHCCQRTHL